MLKSSGRRPYRRFPVLLEEEATTMGGGQRGSIPAASYTVRGIWKALRLDSGALIGWSRGYAYGVHIATVGFLLGSLG
jgi:hypothetical protein